jgi:hypothetical protein
VVKQGRPSKYTEELGDFICYQIATSKLGIQALCDKFDEFPDHSNIYRWRYMYKEFGLKFLEAKRHQTELIAEDILDMCTVNGYTDEKGIDRVDPGTVARQRLLVDTVKWQASKLAPKIYGDRQTIETTINTDTEKLKQELSVLRARLDEAHKSSY